ncbi:MAG: hypothetical protein EBS77_09720 [Gammaproteobacteria bacterium]|nr:hypothetical protein [Gammaproteobacteria bacterium]
MAMSKVKLTSASRTSSGLEIGIKGKPKPGKLTTGYFSIVDEDGITLQPLSAQYSSKSSLSLRLQEPLDPTKSLVISYSSPKKDKKSGVIQSKSGKDAKSWLYNLGPSSADGETSQDESSADPLTNAWTYNGHTYQLINSPKSWEAARADAITRGGYLAEINDLAENEAIYSQLQARAGSTATRAADGGDSRYIWLGGTDRDNEGQWTWSYSGQSISTGRSEWGSGALGSEPDNFNGQDALAIGMENWPRGSRSGSGYGNAGQWNDLDENNTLFYVIEYGAVLPIA